MPGVLTAVKAVPSRPGLTVGLDALLESRAADVSAPLVAVVAHPDDDTFACSGTVALHADEPDFRFTLVHATSGEAGMISDPSLATRENLGAVREEEDRRSWIALGREPDRHEFLRYPDGGVADVPFDELVERIAAILREERPDVVITFGPEGVTGHADHITVGRATTEAFHRCRVDGSDGFRRLLYSSIPNSMIERFNEELVASGKEPIDPTQPFQPRGVPDRDDRRRRRLLERRRSQAGGDPRTSHAGQRLLRRARGRGVPARDPRDRVAGTRGRLAPCSATCSRVWTDDPRRTVGSSAMDVEIRTIAEDEFEDCLRAIELSFSGGVTPEDLTRERLVAEIGSMPRGRRRRPDGRWRHGREPSASRFREARRSRRRA